MACSLRTTALMVVPAVLALLAGGLLPRPAAADAAPDAGDARRGARLAYTCLGCHGIADYRNAYPNYHVPKIGGQHATYLAAALTEYRAGARPHPTMQGQAATLTEQQIRDVAAYFATDRPVASAGATGTAPAALAVCSACHGADGVGVLPEYPTLSGQHADYLAQALAAYRAGARQNAIMNGFAAALKEADIQALAHYFAAQRPALWAPRPPPAP